MKRIENSTEIGTTPENVSNIYGMLVIYRTIYLCPTLKCLRKERIIFG
jgi:hypothetical protein